jgi:hypothetical protein
MDPGDLSRKNSKVHNLVRRRVSTLGVDATFKDGRRQ